MIRQFNFRDIRFTNLETLELARGDVIILRVLHPSSLQDVDVSLLGALRWRMLVMNLQVRLLCQGVAARAELRFWLSVTLLLLLLLLEECSAHCCRLLVIVIVVDVVDLSDLVVLGEEVVHVHGDPRDQGGDRGVLSQLQ